MNALAVTALLLVEDRIFILGQHFLLARHLVVPPVDGFRRLALARESRGDCVHYLVDGAQALPLTGLLRRRDAPWGLPVYSKMGTLERDRDYGSVYRGCRVKGSWRENPGNGISNMKIRTREDPRTTGMKA